MAILHERIAMITGGGTGIGAAIARRAAAEGAAVFLVGRREKKLLAVAASIREEGGRAALLAADVAAPGAAARIVDSCVEKLGGLDVVFNNAAHYQPGASVEESDDEFRRHFEVNVEAPARLLRHAHAVLARSAAPVVVNILTTLAHRPVAGVGAYAASKAALLSLTRSWALEWASDGIRVVGVAPGVVDTPIHDEGSLAAMAPAHPLGRVGTADEVAAAAVFLAGDESAWTTGAVLDVDGGIAWA